MAPCQPKVNSLIRSRSTVKQQLRRISNYVTSFQASDEIQQIVTRNERLSAIWSSYEEIQSKLEAIDFEAEANDRDEFENEFYNTSAEIKRILAERNQATSKIEQQLQRGDTGLHQQVEADKLSKINLPKMNLPQFSGEYKDWRSFYDLFKAIIHDNNSISDIEKLFYLKSSLTGDAAKVIESIPSTADNYENAFKLLTDRYDNNHLIINAHLSNLFALTPLQKQSAAALRNLITDAKQQIESLKAMKLPVEHWDIILIHLLTQKLDFVSRREWELKKAKDKLPKLIELFTFLESRCLSLEAIEPAAQTASNKSAQSFNKPKLKHNQIVAVAANQSTAKCHLCQANHKLYKCDTFLSSDVKTRIEAVKLSKVCFNCLNYGHSAKNCHGSRCRKCGKTHNTLIHIQSVTNQDTEKKSTDVSLPLEQETVTLLSSSQPKQILLSTAIIKVRNKLGAWINCRALLDSGSQSNCITEKLITQLNIARKASNSNIVGINGVNTQVTDSVKLNISSRVTNYQTSLEFLVLDKITNDLPNLGIDVSKWKLPKTIELADPSFYRPGQIDLLIGAEIYFNVLKLGQINLGDNLPTIQNSTFGWILSGKMEQQNSQVNTYHTHFTSVAPSVDDVLLRFWELENFPKKTLRSREENECEEHFKNTIQRDDTGRYVAQLPLREDKINLLGNTRTFAERRLHYLWRRLSSNSNLRSQYVAFMQEYLMLNHMEPVNNFVSEENEHYFIPHHAVVKDTNNGQKLRVVFDASMKSDTGISLNDALKVGPVVQQDLLSIVLRFRLYEFAFTTDIQKMYRQILIDKKQQKYQLILWKDNLNEDIKVFRLRTVTYGTASAPYVATKCIQHLALTEGDSYPLAKTALLESCYVDDIMTGANSMTEALSMQNQLIELLHTGGFTLHKWCANRNELLNNIDVSKREITQPLEIGKGAIKTLGLLWLPSQDKFKFAIKLRESNLQKVITKRSILSDTAGIFDPLGLLGPIVVKAKLFLQQIWKLKTTWDEEVPAKLAIEWTSFRKKLQQIENFEVDRRIIHIRQINAKYEIHGFADASQVAYGACLYLKVINDDNEVSVKLIAAKSRVAPVKPVTIPRLELCAALVLARLLDKVLISLQLKEISTHLWTDSTIVLKWLSSEPSRYKTFVGNRILETQELTKGYIWHHVPTTQNPADYISRGITPMELRECILWWNGPSWLQLNESEWPRTVSTNNKNNDVELKPVDTISAVCVEKLNLFTKFSSLWKLQRVTAYIKRFIWNTRNPEQKLHGELLLEELESALKELLKIAQDERFKEEINSLKVNQEIKRGPLRALSPFIDNQMLLRVGGRLQNSLREFEHNHPIILPKYHELTTLIIRFEHIRLLHAGTQAVLGSIRENYWPIHGRSTVRKIIHQCMICCKLRAKPCQQLMGNLPSYRTQPSRAFLHTGVDYGGPILVKSSNRRNAPSTKSYIALFICLSTRAIHLELVFGLSTQAFLSAFKRFISRRGVCQTIHSDNATNFKGAAKEMQELYKLFLDQNKTEIINEATKLGVKWKFIPPSSPHVGGIWEAGIKAVKHHLRRIMGTMQLTFEETYTLLTQIEACVNSRPLTLISDDPTDPSILTPAHFLIGCPITAMPEPDLTGIQETRLSKWQRLQVQLQSFWKRWSQDYLNTLQQRNKWTRTTRNLMKDDVVLLKEDNQPPLQWPLARILEVHPGSDGKVRFATITTSTGTYKRPITKLCLLPTSSEESF